MFCAEYIRFATEKESR